MASLSEEHAVYMYLHESVVQGHHIYKSMVLYCWQGSSTYMSRETTMIVLLRAFSLVSLV